jgi:hypothetical protein
MAILRRGGIPALTHARTGPGKSSMKSAKERGFPACDIPLRQILPGINHTASAAPQDVVNGEG